MGIILPLLFLGAGFGLAMLLPEHWGNRLKESASALLTRWIIPAVIIYTVATSRPELFFVAASTMVLMLLGVLCAGRITRDPVQKLAFVYLNAGLFGIPVAPGSGVRKPCESTSARISATPSWVIFWAPRYYEAVLIQM